jgi:hypothetical protein
MSRARLALVLIGMGLAGAAPGHAQSPEPTPEPDVTPPEYRLRIQSVVIDAPKRRIAFFVDCRETREPCVGVLRLRTRSSKPTRFAMRRFNIAQGTEERVILRPSRASAVRLRRAVRSKRRLIAVSRVQDLAGNRTTRSLTFVPVRPRREL